MSSSHQNLGPDPSMEEILSSIRRILREDEGIPDEAARDHRPAGDEGEAAVIDAGEQDAAREDTAGEVASERHVAEEDTSAVFVLDPSMLVAEAPVRAAPKQPVPPPSPQEPSFQEPSLREPPLREPPLQEPPLREPPRTAPAPAAPDPAMMLAHGGPTLDEIVRDEIRPLLQAWLDSHLPAMIDGIAREEIARLIDQSRR